MRPGQIAAFVAIIAGVVTVAFVLLLKHDSYTLHVQFTNAGRLVEGGEVQVAGRKVGAIQSVDVTQDGLAVIELSISDEDLVPLRRGTRAAIRAVGAATLANNFVDIRPGPRSGAALADGATLTTDQTVGIVDLDAILSSLDPPTRTNIQRLISRAGDVFAGSGSAYFNRTLARLSPALAELDSVSADLASDHAQLSRFISDASRAASAIASRKPELRAAVGNTARTMRALADNRAALADDLRRAPPVLRQGGRTLGRLTRSLVSIQPALRDLPPVARPLRRFLGRLTTALPVSAPTLAALRQQLPDVRTALDRFPPLRSPAVAALRSTATALRDAQPVLRGLRIYAPDLLIGVLNGLVSLSSGNFNKAGHYVHVSLAQTAQGALGNEIAPILAARPLAPNLFAIRTGITSKCPGGTAPPAPDGSNPWMVDPSLCNPADDLPAKVNRP